MGYKDIEKKREYDRKWRAEKRANKKEPKASKEANEIIDLVMSNNFVIDAIVKDCMVKHPELTETQVKELLIELYTYLLKGVKQGKDDAVTKKADRILNIIKDVPAMLTRDFDNMALRILNGAIAYGSY